MPGPAFFQKLGCFIRSDFLSVQQCAEICSEMRTAALENGEVVGARKTAEEPDTVNENIRRVLAATVARPVRRDLCSRLDELKAELEKHFDVTLTGRDGPVFLRYEPGHFYRPHRDTG